MGFGFIEELIMGEFISLIISSIDIINLA